MVGNDIYEYGGLKSYSERYIEGTLQSQTARIKEFRVIEDPEAKTKCENNKESIFVFQRTKIKRRGMIEIAKIRHTEGRRRIRKLLFFSKLYATGYHEFGMWCVSTGGGR